MRPSSSFAFQGLTLFTQDCLIPNNNQIVSSFNDFSLCLTAVIFILNVCYNSPLELRQYLLCSSMKENNKTLALGEKALMKNTVQSVKIEANIHTY
jgi:hypothetical protein